MSMTAGPTSAPNAWSSTRTRILDWVNLGTYRAQVQDEKTLTVFIEPGKHGSIIREKYWKQGASLPDGGLRRTGTDARRRRVDLIEGRGVGADSAGGRLGHPIKVVRGELTGLPIPADAELAFEGFMPPPEEETRPEGPFAEWPGYYATDAGEEPVVRVGAIYHRNDPILIGQPPAKPTFPGRQPSLAGMAAIWDALEAAGVPGVTGVWKPLGGGVGFMNVISIKQLHPGHAKMAGTGRRRLRSRHVHEPHHRGGGRRHRHHQHRRSCCGLCRRAGTRRPRPTSSTAATPAISTR